MTYDRSAIMKAAWVRVRRADRSRFPLRVILRNAMRTAWAEAKLAAMLADGPRLVSTLAAQIAAIESKDYLTRADWRELEALRLKAAA